MTADERPTGERLLHYYHDMYRAHANDPATGKCRICDESRCADWRHAYERLTVAGISVSNQASPLDRPAP